MRVLIYTSVIPNEIYVEGKGFELPPMTPEEALAFANALIEAAARAPRGQSWETEIDV